MRYELRLYSCLKKYKNNYIPLAIVDTDYKENILWNFLTKDEIKICKREGFYNVDFNYILHKRFEIINVFKTSDNFNFNVELGNNLRWKEL